MASAPIDVSAGVRVRVPAKINVALGVGPRRDDGYHPLTTVFQALSLYDDLMAEPADPGTFELTVLDPAPGVPPDGDNLAVRAAQLLAGWSAGRELGARITLRKTIPVAGGMAGGSADAAAALLACSVLWDLDIDPEELRELGAELGSDVPFPLLGGTALGTGRGEQLVPVLTRGTYHWVLAFADRGLSTAEVFARFDERADHRPVGVPTELIEALGSGDALRVAAHVRNDLTDAAIDLRPELAETLAAGESCGALAALVSGSGPTCAFLAATEDDARELAGRLAVRPGVHAVTRASGPVAGAKIVSSLG